MTRYGPFVSLWAGLMAPPASASYPCPAGPGPGEQQIGVTGGSHGIAAVPVCVGTAANGEVGQASGGGGYAGYRCDGCNIFADPGPPSHDAMAIAAEEQEARNLEAQKLLREADAKWQALEADPAYQRYKKGEWTFFQGRKDAGPGENCVAMWSKDGGAVSIVGPGPAYRGGMLIFWSADIPRPSEIQTVAVTLKQSAFQPQSVNALNFSVPGMPSGAIGLTVPNIESALGTMLDVEHFVVEMGGQTVAEISWTDGLSAKATLSQCVAGR